MTLFINLSLPNYVSCHSLKTGYVPWGIDEYELFGLTKLDLLHKFKGQLNFDAQFSHAGLDYHGYGGSPQFLITFNKSGCVNGVQRLIVDGAGCNIKGPLLTSKKDALLFFIDGLSKIQRPLNSQEQNKLKMARQLLVKLRQ